MNWPRKKPGNTRIGTTFDASRCNCLIKRLVLKIVKHTCDTSTSFFVDLTLIWCALALCLEMYCIACILMGFVQ